MAPPNSEIWLWWGEVVLSAPASGIHVRQLHTDSVLSLYMLVLREEQGFAQGHPANRWQSGD